MYFNLRRSRAEKVFPVRQRNGAECGLATVLWLTHYLKVPVSYGQLLKILRPGRDGNSLRELRDSLRKFGVDTSGYRGSIRSFDGATPFIAHWQNSHFVVVWEIDTNRELVSIMDPAEGHSTISLDHAQAQFQAVGLVVKSVAPISRRQRLSALLNRWSLVGHLIKGTLPSLIMLGILSIGIAALGIFPSYLISNMLDGMQTKGQGTSLLLFIAALMIFGLFTYANGRLQAKLGFKIANDAAKLIANRLFAIAYPAVESIGTSEILVKVQAIFNLRDAIGNRIAPMLSDGVLCLVAGTVLLYVSPPHFALASLVLMAIVFVYVLSARRAYGLNLEILDANEQSNDTLVGSVTNIFRTKAEGEDLRAEELWTERNTDFLRAFYAREIFNLKIGMPQVLVQYGFPVACLLLGVVLVNSGSMTIGKAVGLVTLTQVFTGPATQFGMNLQSLFGLGASVERINDLFLEPPESVYWQGKFQTRNLVNLEVNHSGEGFDQRGVRIPNVQFSVTQGDFVALVGPSGSGKSTVLASILGLTGPLSAGAVRVNGHDLNELDVRTWRQAVSFLPQDYSPEVGSIRDIVRSGNLLTDPEIWDFLAQVGLKEEVEAFPLKLSTVVGGSGGSLSGGQMKRLGIARALGRNSLLLVLDEPTDSLPTAQAEEVFSALRELPIPVVVATHFGNVRKYANEIIELG